MSFFTTSWCLSAWFKGGLTFSPDGRWFAFGAGNEAVILDAQANWKERRCERRREGQVIFFLGTFILCSHQTSALPGPHGIAGDRIASINIKGYFLE